MSKHNGLFPILIAIALSTITFQSLPGYAQTSPASDFTWFEMHHLVSANSNMDYVVLKTGPNQVDDPISQKINASIRTSLQLDSNPCPTSTIRESITTEGVTFVPRSLLSFSTTTINDCVKDADGFSESVRNGYVFDVQTGLQVQLNDQINPQDLGTLQSIYLAKAIQQANVPMVLMQDGSPMCDFKANPPSIGGFSIVGKNLMLWPTAGAGGCMNIGTVLVSFMELQVKATATDSPADQQKGRHSIVKPGSLLDKLVHAPLN